MAGQDISLVVSRWSACDDPYFNDPLRVLLDGREIGQLNSEETKRFPLTAGRHVVQSNYSSYKSRPIKFEASPGSTIYFETGFTGNMFKRIFKTIYIFLENDVIELRERKS